MTNEQKASVLRATDDARQAVFAAYKLWRDYSVGTTHHREIIFGVARLLRAKADDLRRELESALDNELPDNKEYDTPDMPPRVETGGEG